MRLAWMVMFALPLVMFTACGDDEPDGDDDQEIPEVPGDEDDVPAPPQATFTDFSVLLRMTGVQVINYMNTSPTDELSDYYVYGFEVNKGNVENVYAYFTDLDENADGEFIMFNTVQIADVELSEAVKSYEVQNLFNYLYVLVEVDEDGDYKYISEEQQMRILYMPEDNEVVYYNIAPADETNGAGVKGSDAAIVARIKEIVRNR